MSLIFKIYAFTGSMSVFWFNVNITNLGSLSLPFKSEIIFWLIGVVFHLDFWDIPVDTVLTIEVASCGNHRDMINHNENVGCVPYVTVRVHHR